jgi:lipid A 3-O-deacylase
MKRILLAMLLAASGGNAWAQVDEVRVGVGAHDLRIIEFRDIDPKEKSVVLNGEVIFEKPDFFKWKYAPRPYAGGQLNLGGGTSYGGAGFVWRQNFGKNFYGDFAFGLVVHDGSLEVEPPREIIQQLETLNIIDLPPDQRFDAAIPFFTAFDNELAFRRANTIEYGSRVLFREQFTLGVNLDDKWATEAYFEHVSHGNILSNGSNDGSDSAGIRLNRKF